MLIRPYLVYLLNKALSEPERCQPQVNRQSPDWKPPRRAFAPVCRAFAPDRQKPDRASISRLCRRQATARLPCQGLWHTVQDWSPAERALRLAASAGVVVDFLVRGTKARPVPP